MTFLISFAKNLFVTFSSIFCSSSIMEQITRIKKSGITRIIETRSWRLCRYCNVSTYFFFFFKLFIKKNIIFKERCFHFPRIHSKRSEKCYCIANTGRFHERIHNLTYKRDTHYLENRAFVNLRMIRLYHSRWLYGIYHGTNPDI